jgi:hypothetical protein
VGKSRRGRGSKTIKRGRVDHSKYLVWESRQRAAARVVWNAPGAKSYSCASRRHMDLISAVAAIAVRRAVEVDKVRPRALDLPRNCLNM